MTPIMGVYQRRLLPWLTDLAMRGEALAPYRRQAVDGLRGNVLEIGIGSGLNFAFYGAGSAVVGIDPSAALLAKAAARSEASGLDVRLIRASAEALPLACGVFDAALLTWTLCSIPDPAAALGEIRRVLKPGGELRFVEHGRAPEPGVRRWQNRATPTWKRITGGCHLNREIDALLAAAGFELTELVTAYAPGPKILTYFYTGRARARPSSQGIPAR